MPRAANIIRTVSVILLMTLFVLPLAGHILTPDKTVSSLENRSLQQRPKWTGNWTKFRGEFDLYLNDQFGFRSIGIQADNHLKRVLEGEQPLVILGQNDWLFLSEPELWASYQGKNHSPSKIETWLDGLASLKSTADDNGAEFYAFIVPNKARVYPEHAPIRYGQPSNHVLSDLLQDPRSEDLHLLDVMTPILSAKKTGQVYFRTDTHWTTLGAYQAYTTLLDAVNRDGMGLPVLAQDQLSIKKTEDRKDDLYRLLADPNFPADSLARYSAPKAKGFKPRKFDKKSHASEQLQSKIFERKNPKSTIVIIGDSFSDRLVPLLKHSFDRIVIVHHQEGEFHLGDVFKFSPDVALFAPVERFGEKRSIFPKGPATQ